MPDDLISLVVGEGTLSVLEEQLFSLFLDVSDDTLAIVLIKERSVVLLGQVASRGRKFVYIFVRSVDYLFGR